MILDRAVWEGKIFAAGGWAAGDGGVYPAVEPATGSKLAEIGAASAADVADAAGAAARAQRDWAARPYDHRAEVLRRAGDLFVEHADEIHEWLIRESGATRPFAAFQTSVAADECREAAALAAAPYGRLLRSNQQRLSFVQRLPVGVVGVIAPFNVPIILAIRAIAPALALGNAVLVKPDPRTAVCGGVVFARIFEEAGLPAGLLQVLPGDGGVGAAIVDHPLIPVIAFTGSTRAGKSIAAAAATHLKRVHLELGGNSALIVLDDVDLERAVSAGAFGSFNHSGQICMATGRHLVDARIAADYAALLAEHAERIPVGDPFRDSVGIGPVIDAKQRDNMHRIVTESVDAGAQLRAGGTYEGLFYRPTVLSDVPVTAAAYAEEVFGPVAPVVAFDGLDEAVALANGTGYGLALGILTRDVMRGLSLAERIPSGLVHINDQTVNDEAVAPFGGVADSGTGSRHGGPDANLEAFTEAQWVTVRGDLPAYPF